MSKGFKWELDGESADGGGSWSIYAGSNPRVLLCRVVYDPRTVSIIPIVHGRVIGTGAYRYLSDAKRACEDALRAMIPTTRTKGRKSNV